MSYSFDLKRVTAIGVHCLSALCLLLLPTTGAFGDSITVDGVHYDEVYIRQSTALYYICMPDTGHVMNARKTDVDPQSVSITKDFDVRAGILERWKQNQTRPAVEATEPSAEAAALEYESVSDLVGKERDARLRTSSVSIPFLRGKGERVHNPELERRIQANLAGSRSRGAGVTGRGVGSGRASGLAGGSGAGRGGGGGGATGGGAGGNAFFSNISELFGTIDDASVGEFPNPFSQSGGAGGGQGIGRR